MRAQAPSPDELGARGVGAIVESSAAQLSMGCPERLSGVESAGAGRRSISAPAKPERDGLVRGARSGVEFDAEMRLADVNRAYRGIETVIIPALPELASFSSRVVVRELRQLQRHDVDVSP